MFNAVSEYQTGVVKEGIAEEREKSDARTKHIQSTGNDKNTGAVNFASIIENIKQKPKRWAALEDDEYEYEKEQEAQGL